MAKKSKFPYEVGDTVRFLAGVGEDVIGVVTKISGNWGEMREGPKGKGMAVGLTPKTPVEVVKRKKG